MPSTAYAGTTLTRAAEATTKLKGEIDQLWRDSVNADDLVAADRLVAVSHAIDHVFDLIDGSPVIG
ncbi:MAG: hypothetical protein ABI894_14440 [Ilumatobacteraceae bacterium]